MSYRSYNKTNEMINTYSGVTGSAEKVAEANRNITDMRSDILRLKIMVQAMMEIMAEQGVDPALINSKIEEIMERPDTFMPVKKASKPCPSCGRVITDNGGTPLTGTCLYCGTVVKFPPEFHNGEKKPDDSGDDNPGDNDPLDDQYTMPMQ
jgi:hypothetical protein